MAPQTATILIVDDEPGILQIGQEYLEQIGYDCTTTLSAQEAIALLGRERFDLVLTDLHLGDLTGMDILRQVRHGDPAETMVVLMTAFPTIENAIETLKSGAEDYLLKPFKLKTLELVVGRVLEKQRLARENISLRETLALYRTSEALEAPLELPEYLDMVLDVSVRELQGEAAQLSLLERVDESAEVRRRRDPATAGEDLFLSARAIRTLADELRSGDGPLLRTREGGQPLMVLPLRTGGELVGLIAVHRQRGQPSFTPSQARTLGIIGSGAAVAIKNARLYNSLQEHYLKTMQALVAAVEAKDPFTSGHSEMVSRYAVALAREIGLPPEQVDGLRVAGLLHDAGKIGVPEKILLKPGELTPEEYDVIKEHVRFSERIVKPLGLDPFIFRAITEHHERLDGSGYPQGLIGEQLSLGGRLMAIADSFDAMTNERVYRSGLDRAEAVATLRRLAPGQLDGDLTHTCLTLLEKWDQGKIEIPRISPNPRLK